MLNRFLKLHSLPLIRGQVGLTRISASPVVGTHRRFSKNPFKSPPDEFSERDESETNQPLDKEKKRKILEMEMYVARQDGRRAPDPAMLKEEHWEELLSIESRTGRAKFYGYLWQVEKKKESKERKKIEKQEKLAERKVTERLENEQNDHIIYSLQHTSLMLRIYDTTINLWQNHRLMQAMQFGEKVILDCSYDKHMNKREAVNTAKQLMLSFAENRMHSDPFDLHYCNANMQGITMQYLERHIPTMHEPSFPLNIHTKCYTQLFPKECLVYLTPHCRTELLKYNPDDIYIIGAMVDKVNNEPLSLAKAKRLGLRMAKLPLDRYMQWGSGSGKSLTINQVLNILLDVKVTGDWKFALRHVPRRKIVQEEPLGDESSDRKILRKRAEKFSFDVDSWGSGNRYRKKL